MSAEVWDQVYRRLVLLIEQHRTSLVFVNTRRMAERVTRKLSELMGESNVTAHHGSLTKEQRLQAEQRLKHGKLKALIATASLELGIDIGDVDLVCQLASPRRARLQLSCSASVGLVMRSAARPRAGCFRCRGTNSSDVRRCSIAFAATSSIASSFQSSRWTCWRSRSLQKWRV
jgi:ATP-dependent Lhr-like helicase